MDTYIYAAWDDSRAIYPGNRPDNFLLDLPHILSLRGDWYIALCDVKIKTQAKKSVFVLCDVCEESYVKGSKYPVLNRQDTKSTEIANRCFLKVIMQDIQRIRIWLLTEDWEREAVSDFKCKNPGNNEQ